MSRAFDDGQDPLTAENPNAVPPPAHPRPSGLRARFRRFWDRYEMYGIVSAIALMLAVLFFWPNIVHVVPAGHAGVLFKRLGGGTQTEYVRDEGLQLTMPWDVLTVYDVRVQQELHDFHILSSNGLVVGVRVSIRYRPKIDTLGLLHKEIGPDYLDKIVVPEVQALIRTIFGQYSPEEIYTTKRAIVQNAVEHAVGEIGEKYIILDDLLIESIELPPMIENAIQAKLTEQQRVLEMEFRIQRERFEAERKVIEASGVNLYQAVIGETLTEPLLRYEGIQATRLLAASPNAKMVVIGGKEGMPLILNTGDIQGPPPMTSPVTNAFVDSVRSSLLSSTNLPSFTTSLTNLMLPTNAAANYRPESNLK